MDVSSSRDSCFLEQVITNYELLLAAVEAIPSKTDCSASSQLVTKMLLARDAVEQARLENATQENLVSNADIYIRLIELDQRLKQQVGVITTQVDLEVCRQSVAPDKSAWWWFLEIPVKEKKHKSDRFDWVWNGLTVVFLVSATSFATSTANAFAIQGFDVLGLFSSFSQGAGLALVAGGAFTDKGKKTVRNVLKSISIPTHYHAEATCLFSISLFLIAWSVHSNLYRLGNIYYEWGKVERREGDNIGAFRSFQKASNFDPDKKEVYSALGQISEKMGRLDDAISYYEQGISLSDSASALGFGRITLINALKEVGWTADIEAAKIREIELFLELTTQFNRRFDDDGKLQLIHYVLIEQYTHFGLLELAKIDLENLNFSSGQDISLADQRRHIAQTQNHIKAALQHFEKAHLEELILLGASKQNDPERLKGMFFAQRQLLNGFDMNTEIAQLGIDYSNEEIASEEKILFFLETLTYWERTNLIDDFIEGLSTSSYEKLSQEITFDLGKPRCYVAVSRFLDSFINLKSQALSEPNARTRYVDTLRQKRINADNACGLIQGRNTVNLYTLSIYDRTMMSKLLDVPRPFLPEIYE